MSKPHHDYALDPKPIGRGGQAEVFRARDKRTGQFVAFKRLLQDNRYNEDAIARMRREIDVQTTLTHPNIMPIMDYSEQHYWYTMPIAEINVKELPIPVDLLSLFKIIEDSAQGLLYAHRAGNIHRDITPNNILKLTPENEKGRWVVSDWGLVRRQGRTTIVRTPAGNQFGTAGFAAPEMWQDAHAVDERADVYSLGRVVTWCLTGVWPVPNIPVYPQGPFFEFVTATTNLNPSERLRNMQEVLDMIERLKISLESVSILEALKKLYNDWLLNDLENVNIKRKNRKILLEVTRRGKGSFSDTDIAEHTINVDLGFIVGNETSYFPPDCSVIDNAMRFLERLDAYSLLLSGLGLYLFSAEGQSEIMNLHDA